MNQKMTNQQQLVAGAVTVAKPNHVAERATIGVIRRRKVFTGLSLILVLAALGAAGYVLGHSTGEDLNAARVEGTAQGQREGAVKGAEEGFAAGRQRGRNEAYAESYERSYQAAYSNAYEDAGLDPPEDIPVPRGSE
jgi:flagellar biosynthesis/type III secretory pathway protein FliH